MAWTTDDLLVAVRRAAFLPDASDQSDDDLLAFADEALETLVAAAVRPARDGRWVSSESIVLVSGEREYQLPRRALGTTVSGIMLYEPGGMCFPLTPTDQFALRAAFDGVGSGTGTPGRYAFEESVIRLDTAVSASGWVMRVFYVRTPPKLILTSAAAEVVNVVTDKITVDVTVTPPSTVTTAGALVDVIAGVEPYFPRVIDAEVESWISPDITLTTDMSGHGIELPVVNRQSDYVCPAETTVYPPIPRTMWSALVRETAALCLKATRDPGARDMQLDAERARDLARTATVSRDARRSTLVLGSSPLRLGRRGR